MREITPTLNETMQVSDKIHVRGLPGLIRDIQYSSDGNWVALGRRTHLLPPLENASMLSNLSSTELGSAVSLMQAIQQPHLNPNFALLSMPGIELLTGLQRAPGLESCEIRDAKTYRVIKTLPADIFCFSQDSAQLAVSVFALYTGVSFIEIYDTHGFHLIYRFQAHLSKNLLRAQFYGSISALQYSCYKDKRILASGGDSGNIFLWDAMEFKTQPIVRFEKHIAPVVSLTFCPISVFLLQVPVMGITI